MLISYPPTIPPGLVVGRGRQSLRTSSIRCPSTRRCTVMQVGFGTLGGHCPVWLCRIRSLWKPNGLFPTKWSNEMGDTPMLQDWLVNCKVERKSERIQSQWWDDAIPSNPRVRDLRLLCLLISKSKHCRVQNRSAQIQVCVPITSVPSKEMVVVWCSLCIDCIEGFLLLLGFAVGEVLISSDMVRSLKTNRIWTQFQIPSDGSMDTNSWTKIYRINLNNWRDCSCNPDLDRWKGYGRLDKRSFL